MSVPTHADEIEMVVKILVDAPAEGVSLDEIQEVTESIGRRLTLREINAILCNLGGKIAHEKMFIKGKTGKKVTRFRLKLNRI